MNILINGASGFLGKHLIARLSEHEDIVITAFSSVPQNLKKEFRERTNIIFAERDGGDWFENADLFINCAFPRNNDATEMAKGLKYISDQLVKAVQHNVKAVINISSQSVYSSLRLNPADETTEVALETNYAVGKYAAELLTNSICRTIPHVNIRMGSLMGAGFNQRLINRFVYKVVLNEDITIKEGGINFGLLDIRDAVNALERMVNSDPLDWKELYVLGSRRGYSISDLAEVAVEIGREYGYLRTRIHKESSNDRLNSMVNASLFENDFQWKEVYSLKDTTRAIFDSLQ